MKTRARQMSVTAREGPTRDIGAGARRNLIIPPPHASRREISERFPPTSRNRVRLGADRVARRINVIWRAVHVNGRCVGEQWDDGRAFTAFRATRRRLIGRRAVLGGLRHELIAGTNWLFDWLHLFPPSTHSPPHSELARSGSSPLAFNRWPVVAGSGWDLSSGEAPASKDS